MHRLIAAWNEGRPEAIAALFAERAFYVTTAGQVLSGRAAIAELLRSPAHGPVRLECAVTVKAEGSAHVVAFAWSGVTGEREGRGVIACTVVPARAGG